MKETLSRGDIRMVSGAMAELLDHCHLNLDRSCAAYRKAGLAVLSADVRGLEVVERQSKGLPIETPAIAHPQPAPSAPQVPQGASN